MTMRGHEAGGPTWRGDQVEGCRILAPALGWVPHKPATWTARYGTLRRAVTMEHFTGTHGPGGPVMRRVECPAGTRVKVVMVSRFGDVGITEDLAAGRGGYGARVYLDDLADLSMDPEGRGEGA